MNNHVRKWLVGFAKAVRLDEWYSHWDMVDALSSSATGKIVWCQENEMYKVKFYNPTTRQGFIDGYRTARRAKEVVAAYKAQYEKDSSGLTAEYLGKD